MLTILTAIHIRGARSVKGFRACLVSTGVPASGQEASRLVRAELGRANRESRRRWLVRLWEAHRVRVRTRSGFQRPKGQGYGQECIL